MAHSTAAVPVGALEQGCPIRVEHDRRRRQFTVRLNGNAVTGPTPAFCLPATGARRGRPLAGARDPWPAAREGCRKRALRGVLGWQRFGPALQARAGG